MSKEEKEHEKVNIGCAHTEYVYRITDRMRGTAQGAKPAADVFCIPNHQMRDRYKGKH